MLVHWAAAAEGTFIADGTSPALKSSCKHSTLSSIFAAIAENIDLVQAVPYAQDELVLLVPFSHELAQRGSIEKCELYNLDFVSMNQGSSVQAAQEETLLQQGIKWHKLHTHMVGLCSSCYASLHAGQQASLRPAHEARMHC